VTLSAEDPRIGEPNGVQLRSYQSEGTQVGGDGNSAIAQCQCLLKVFPPLKLYQRVELLAVRVYTGQSLHHAPQHVFEAFLRYTPLFFI
jgi:hypothetical protein